MCTLHGKWKKKLKKRSACHFWEGGVNLLNTLLFPLKLLDDTLRVIFFLSFFFNYLCCLRVLKVITCSGAVVLFFNKGTKRKKEMQPGREGSTDNSQTTLQPCSFFYCIYLLCRRPCIYLGKNVQIKLIFINNIIVSAMCIGTGVKCSGDSGAVGVCLKTNCTGTVLCA